MKKNRLLAPLLPFVARVAAALAMGSPSRAQTTRVKFVALINSSNDLYAYQPLVTAVANELDLVLVTSPLASNLYNGSVSIASQMQKAGVTFIHQDNPTTPCVPTAFNCAAVKKVANYRQAMLQKVREGYMFIKL